MRVIVGVAFRSRLAASGLMLLMLSTMSLHILKWHSPYWADKGGWQYDLMLITPCGVIGCIGAGAISVGDAAAL